MPLQLLTGRTVLITTSELSNIEYLSGRIKLLGGRVAIAKDYASALTIIRSTAIFEALIEVSFSAARDVVNALKEHHIPYMFYSNSTALASPEHSPVTNHANQARFELVP